MNSCVIPLIALIKCGKTIFYFQIEIKMKKNLKWTIEEKNWTDCRVFMREVTIPPGTLKSWLSLKITRQVKTTFYYCSGCVKLLLKLTLCYSKSVKNVKYVFCKIVEN
jgi:hypothetical protein